jgi:hypothetical protein
MKAVRAYAVALLLLSGLCCAGEIANYPNGIEGIKAASVPPPGWYWRNYNFWYHSDTMRDADGDKVDIDFKLDLVASIQRFLFVTDKTQKAIGAHYAAHICIPLIYADLEIGRMDVDDSRYRVGDIDLAPLIFAWHKPRFDLVTFYDVCIPVGDVHNGEAATTVIGREYWTHQLNFGGTGYLDKEKEWSFSMLMRYEIHSGKKNAHLRPGDQFHFEWGLGKAFPKHNLEVGLAGYCSWQTTADTGKATKCVPDERDRVFAVGPEFNYFIKPVALAINLRYEKEFCARDRPEGHMTTLTLTKKF